MIRPFLEVDDLRFFNAGAPADELKWHWDHEDRTVEVLTNDGDWELQFDNQLPRPLIKGTTVFIQAGEWHRVIQNKPGCLTLRITKHDTNLTRAPVPSGSPALDHEQRVPVRQYSVG